MPMMRAMGAFCAVALLELNFTTCRSPGGAGKEPEAENAGPVTTVDLVGVDTSQLTSREKREWSHLVGELLAPCAEQPVSLAQCVREGRSCATCLPASRFLVKLVRRGKTRSQVEAAFHIRFDPDQVKTVPVRDSPSKGVRNAPVVLVEWADFECPFCAATRPVLDKLVQRYAGTVRVVFKHFPLTIHKDAEYAARAAVAAGKQGKFWEMHARLFENQEALDKRALVRYAREVGLDVKRFKLDLESEEVADVVARDRKDGEALGLEGTPMIYVNGRYFDLDYFDIIEDLPSWIELEAELRTGRRPEPKLEKGKPDARVGEKAAPAASIVPPRSR